MNSSTEANHRQEDLLMQWLNLDDVSSDASDGALHALLCESRLPVRVGFQKSVMESVKLESLFRESRLPVREGFKEDVMAALPIPAWRKAPLRWSVPIAAMVFFALGATVLLSGGGASEGHVFATGGAILDLFTAALMAGAGLFAASWSGLGATLGGLFADAGSMIGFGAMVLFVNLLFFSLLRRRRTATERVSSDS